MVFPSPSAILFIIQKAYGLTTPAPFEILPVRKNFLLWTEKFKLVKSCSLASLNELEKVKDKYCFFCILLFSTKPVKIFYYALLWNIIVNILHFIHNNSNEIKLWWSNHNLTKINIKWLFWSSNVNWKKKLKLKPVDRIWGKITVGQNIVPFKLQYYHPTP